MRLYFSGHDCRYAAEQSLLMLFPGEKPEYPEGSPSGERCELRVRTRDLDGLHGPAGALRRGLPGPGAGGKTRTRRTNTPCAAARTGS